MLVTLMALCVPTAKGQQWEIGQDYEIAFSGKKAEGTLSGLEGTIRFDPKDLGDAGFDVSVSVATINTGNNTKDKHARSENWFYAKAHPRIHFTSDRIEKTSNGYLAVGELDLRGVKKEVRLPFTFSDRGSTGVFEGELQVNRKDFGIMGNFMEFLVGDDFLVTLVVPVLRGE